MRNNYRINHIMNRDGVYYYIRRVPCDLSDFYAIKRLCFSLKTVGSEREVPLIGISLWAARRIKNNGSPFKFAFPRYTNDHFSNANSASAALNKWLKPFVLENCVIH